MIYKEFQDIYWAPQKKLGGGWICFKDSPSPPPAPDYVGAAQATAAGSLDAARAAAAANRVNQVTPYGSLTYTHDPGTFDQAGYDAAMAKYNATATPSGDGLFSRGTGGPTGTAPNRNDFYTNGADNGWTATQSLAPQQQQLLDQQNKTSLGLAGLADRGLGYVGDALSHNITAGDLPANMVNPGQTGQDALMARFQPMIDQSHKALDSQLANQGIMEGSEAYDNAMRVQNQSENDLRSQAALNGISVGQSAQDQQLGLKMALQNQPLNMLNAVRTGSQVTNPTFGTTPQQQTTGGPNLLGATTQAGQYGQGLYNSQVGATNSANAAGAGLASTAALLMFSDRRLKSNIVRIGTHPLGIGIYDYEIFGRRQRGVMADEVARVLPAAVHTHPTGFKMVDYGKL